MRNTNALINTSTHCKPQGCIFNLHDEIMRGFLKKKFKCYILQKKLQFFTSIKNQKNIGILNRLYLLSSIVFIKKKTIWGFASDTDYFVGLLLFEMHSAFVKFFALSKFLQSFVCLCFLCLTIWYEFIFRSYTKLQHLYFSNYHNLKIWLFKQKSNQLMFDKNMHLVLKKYRNILANHF